MKIQDTLTKNKKYWQEQKAEKLLENLEENGNGNDNQPEANNSVSSNKLKKNNGV